ncbi:MAG: hypothetical protein KDE47_23535, partial [Caldilineaceae bacterium]|nr:hypothetical protein [Caldilineaceae bacterium]
ELAAAPQVEQAWHNGRSSTQYAFSADIQIKTIPLPTAGNIGRFSQTDSLYVEGTNNLAQNTIQMALWGGSVSVADRANAYQVRTQHGRTETRIGDGEWQTSNESAIAFATEGDFLAFLDVVQNVALATDRLPAAGEPACALLDCDHLAVYTFDLDSRAYAQKLTRISQQQLQRSGQLPPGATIQIPPHLANISGAGELWVDGRGLPVRQSVTIAMPPTPSADNRTETVMDIYFSGYQSDPPLFAALPGLDALSRSRARIELPTTSEVSMSMSLFTLAVLGMVILIRPGRRVRAAVTVVMLIAIILTPTLQVQAGALAMDRLSAKQANQAATDAAQAAGQKVLASQYAARFAAPYTPPRSVLNLPADAPTLQSTTLDSDGDGLTDSMEELIGTSPYSSDTDDDTISDSDEVYGFLYNNKRWYGNPLEADSNGDSIIDSMEWTPGAPDSDGDGTPDLYDDDDDNDGVPDDIDISRLVAGQDNMGNAVTFSRANPLQLTVDGLQTGSYTFVDLQLRPTDPDHLWYAYNVLNWPHDEKGNMQDWDGKTFFDHCVATGGGNCQMTPDANGDIKLVPMLEITVRDLNTLPAKADGSLDTELLANYNITVQPSGTLTDTYLVYARLNLVEESVTGNKVAFQTQLLYQPKATWNPQQVRMVWAVNALNEQYADPESAKARLAAQNGRGDNVVTVLHTYDDEFQLTGFNVREDRGVDMAIVYEDPALDPALNEDDALAQMTYGLENSFLTNRDCDFLDNQGQCVGNGRRDITIPEIYRRWNHATNSGITAGEMWGLDANYLNVS